MPGTQTEISGCDQQRGRIQAGCNERIRTEWIFLLSPYSLSLFLLQSSLLFFEFTFRSNKFLPSSLAERECFEKFNFIEIILLKFWRISIIRIAFICLGMGWKLSRSFSFFLFCGYLLFREINSHNFRRGKFEANLLDISSKDSI